MPVPVPRYSKQPAHPVVKQSGDPKSTHPTVFKNLSCTLPVAPTRPPPSFGTRQEWINSLPPWRRAKPRRVWEDDSRFAEHSGEHYFAQGLTAAANATVIKGTRAQACISPLSTAPRTADTLSNMPPDYFLQAYGEAPDVEMSNFVDEYVGSAFSPLLFEDDSPIARDASPLEPTTPFGEFVDRVVAAHDYAPYPTIHPAMTAPDMPYSLQPDLCGPECYQAVSYVQAEQVKEQPTATEIATPSATDSYRKLAEPLSEWVANYVWKACSTGMGLSSASSDAGKLSTSPPTYLSNSVHSLLLSTLLQPSAVFLAIWYIVRLPIQFGAARLGAEHMAELRFRLELFGDSSTGVDRDALEANAPFRLILLGFMLANKWLDDHTFSNKTWHSISNIPLKSLNKLESLALDIFSYDLSVSTKDWSKWLNHILAYHISLSSPSHPQPISRPSTNPHSIIRKTIEELIQAPAVCTRPDLAPRLEPVFLGLEERKREKEQASVNNYVDVLEINLDEDGPLREEYVPKRRVNAAEPTQRPLQSSAARPPTEAPLAWDTRANPRSAHMEKLPPPAKWSPAGDEPILRERNRASGHYVAVQPPLVGSYIPYGPAYQSWSNYPAEQPIPIRLSYEPPPPLPVGQPIMYHPYPFALPVPLAHSRSHSLSYSQDNSHAHNRLRTYSQSRFEYRHSNIQMTSYEHAPMPANDAPWGAPLDPFVHSAPYIQTFVPVPGPYYQPPWLRN